MKHILFLLIIISYPVLSDSAGSCNNAVLKQCMDFVTGAVSSEAKSAFEKVRGTYSSGSCSRNEAAGICRTTMSGKTVESLFYYPNWTENAAKERCGLAKGEFRRQ